MSRDDLRPANENERSVFEEMLPAIENVLSYRARRLRDEERREEYIQNGRAIAFQEFLALVQLGNLQNATPYTIATYASKQSISGRLCGTSANCRDVYSVECQQAHGFGLARIDDSEPRDERRGWEALITSDLQATPALVVQVKLDFRAWFDSLPLKKRTIALALAGGATTKEVAELFGLTEGRISQLRRELMESWARFMAQANGLA